MIAICNNYSKKNHTTFSPLTARFVLRVYIYLANNKLIALLRTYLSELRLKNGMYVESASH